MKNTKNKVSHIEGGTLTEKERAALNALIKNKKDRRTEKQQLCDRLLTFQANILIYLYNEQEFKPVGEFIREYIQIVGIKKTVFAKQLDIHNTKLSNLLNYRVRVNPFIAYKLEAHSAMVAEATSGIISAVYWIRLQQKEELFQVMNEPEIKYNAYRIMKESSS